MTLVPPQLTDSLAYHREALARALSESPEGTQALLSDEQIRRIDGNSLRLENVIIDIQKKLKRPRRPWRSGAAARVNPDKLWFGYVIAGVNASFILGAFVLSFAGQYAFAPHTQIDPGYYWFIPLALDLPIVASAFTASVFRQRKQNRRANGNWVFVTLLTIISSAVQVVHVLEVGGYFAGETFTLPQWIGVGIMGAMPWLVLYLSENLAGLLVRPIGEAKDPAPAPVKRTPPKKRSTRR